MTALAKAVIVDGERYAAGTDHTAMPSAAVDAIRSPDAWVGGVAPALSVATAAGKPQIIPSDLTNPARARAALGLGTAATRNVGTGANDVAAGNAVSGGGSVTFGTTAGTAAQGNDSRIVGAAQKSANLSDLASAGTARTNLGLGNAATLNVGTGSATAAAGDDSRIVGAAQKSANLSDLASAGTARTNLGLGGAATLSVGTAAGTVADGGTVSSTGTYAARPAAAAGNAGAVYVSTDAGAARSDGSSWARFTAVPRWEKWNPTGSVACNVDRSSAVMGNNTALLTSGRLQLAGGFVIPAGATVSSISFLSGNVAMATPTNYWFVLADINRNVLGKTADATTAAWGGNAVKTLTLTTPWTATADTAVYTGMVIVAGTMPDLRGTNGSAPVNGVLPMTCASADTGLTTPASLGATIGTLTSSAVNPFSYVS